MVAENKDEDNPLGLCSGHHDDPHQCQGQHTVDDTPPVTPIIKTSIATTTQR